MTFRQKASAGLLALAAWLLGVAQSRLPWGAYVAIGLTLFGAFVVAGLCAAASRADLKHWHNEHEEVLRLYYRGIIAGLHKQLRRQDGLDELTRGE